MQVTSQLAPFLAESDGLSNGLPFQDRSFSQESPDGFEPSPPTYKEGVLPLNYGDLRSFE